MPAHRTTLSQLFAWLLAATCAFSAERPNILWITSEDNASSWLGCYGNQNARTPTLDKLAAGGLRFTRAYSNAPVCAVARSNILTGRHAVSLGIQHMRSRYPVPKSIIPYVTRMRSEGYYCTNQSKTDYNIRGNDGALWDACSDKANYRNRPAGSPFFAVINLTISHESSLFPEKIAANRKSGAIPSSPRLDPSQLTLPPYLPDLPEIRSDMAVYHDTITALDRDVERVLTKLEQDGLAEDTIVFYYSDHGGILPRGKRYLEDSGTRVPLIIHFPEKWRHLSPFKPCTAVDEPVSFIDLAPTLLSIAGAKAIPDSMQGRAFLGDLRREPPADDVVFLYGDRFDEIPGMRRGITNGQWKYIRCFTPHLPGAPYSTYQLRQGGWKAWQKAWKDGSLPPQFRKLWEPGQPVEYLFDLTNDPDEVRNLAGDPAHATRLAAMRERLRTEMIRHRDAGLAPESMYASINASMTIVEYLSSRAESLPAIADLALLSGTAQPSHMTMLKEHLTSNDPLARYWATHAARTSPDLSRALLPELRARLEDSEAAIRLTAADGLLAMGDTDALKARILRDLESSRSEALTLAILSLLRNRQSLDWIPDSWIETTMSAGNSMDPYPKRIAQELRRERARRKQPD